MQKLHPTQKSLLELLSKTVEDPLTMNELREELGVSSTSVIFHHIKQLEKKGYLRRNPLNPQDYQVLSDSPEKKITYLNLYGLGSCGPNGTILDGNPIERIPISSKLLGFSSSEAFMIKAKGDSMTPKINNGDLVLVRKTNTAESGEIVVCVNGGRVLIKKFLKGNPNVLSSINEKFDPFVSDDDFRIEGVVKGVLSYFG